MTVTAARWDEVATLLHALLALGVYVAVFWAADRIARWRRAIRAAAQNIADMRADVARHAERRTPAWAHTDTDPHKEH